jgi:hypothetical protein
VAIAARGLSLSQIGFDFLQRAHTLALQVTLAGPRQHWFRQETILDAQPLLDGFFQKFVFSRRHAHNIANMAFNRKSKLPSGNSTQRRKAAKTQSATPDSADDLFPPRQTALNDPCAFASLRLCVKTPP